MDIYEFHPGTQPLLISIPHAGTFVPEDIGERFAPAARKLPDTDWHVDRLYACARQLGAATIKANYSRYVVDLNRSADSAALYVADPTTPVCPERTFGGEDIYMSGREPDAIEIAQRLERYWRPYHERIAAELQALRERHGLALLWDAHSIASEIPGLFAGVLPELNFGTRDDASCPRSIAETLLGVVSGEGRYGAVLNGRFKGGYITDHYGHPDQGVYAVQLELAQRTYMEEAAGLRGWDPQRAQAAVALISQLLEQYLRLARAGG